MIDPSEESLRRLHEHVRVEDGILIITPTELFLKDVDLVQWGVLVTRQWTGPYRQVIIDLERCRRIISAFLSQCIQLRDFYSRQDPATTFWVVNAPQRVIELFHVMSMDSMFTVTPGQSLETRQKIAYQQSKLNPQ